MKNRTRLPRKTRCTRQSTKASRKAASRKAGTAKKVTAAQKSPGVNRSEGIRMFTLAGRPSKEDFVKVYGPAGPKMTWEQRAKAGVPAEKFQAALATALRQAK